MPTVRLGRVACAFALLVQMTAAQADVPGTAPKSPLGRWLSQDHDGVFEITTCGDTLCGRLVGIRYTGSMPTDKDGHPQCDLMMLTGFRRAADGSDRWAGMILDPEKGRRYHAQIWSPEPGSLNLRGYLFLPIFGETQRWTRYDGTIGADCHFPAQPPKPD